MVPISSASGIWSSNSGSTLAGSREPVALTGALSPSLPGVNSTARMSEVALVHGQMDVAPLASALNAMLARLPFTIAQKLEALAGSLEPVALTGALSTSRFSGPSARR